MRRKIDIYQSKNGAIILSFVVGGLLILSLKQISDLNINIFAIEDFNPETYTSYYDKKAGIK